MMAKVRRFMAEAGPVLLVLACLGGTWTLVLAMHRRAEPVPASSPLPQVAVAVHPVDAPPAVVLPEPVAAVPEVEEEPAPDPAAVLGELASTAAADRLAAQAAQKKAQELEKTLQLAKSRTALWRHREQLTKAQAVSLQQQARGVEQELDRLAHLRDVLARRRDEMQQDQIMASLNARDGYAVLPYKGPTGTWRRPIAIECTNGQARIQPDGPAFSLLELSVLGLGSRNGSLPGAVSRLVRQAVTDRSPDGALIVPYVLFIVRPDGIRPYYEARAQLEQTGITFGYELVEQDWKIDYPDLRDVKEWYDAAAPALLATNTPIPTRSSGSSPPASAGASNPTQAGHGANLDGFLWKNPEAGPGEPYSPQGASSGFAADEADGQEPQDLGGLIAGMTRNLEQLPAGSGRLARAPGLPGPGNTRPGVAELPLQEPPASQPGSFPGSGLQGGLPGQPAPRGLGSDPPGGSTGSAFGRALDRAGNGPAPSGTLDSRRPGTLAEGGNSRGMGSGAPTDPGNNSGGVRPGTLASAGNTQRGPSGNSTNAGSTGATNADAQRPAGTSAAPGNGSSVAERRTIPEGLVLEPTPGAGGRLVSSGTNSSASDRQPPFGSGSNASKPSDLAGLGRQGQGQPAGISLSPGTDGGNAGGGAGASGTGSGHGGGSGGLDRDESLLPHPRLDLVVVCGAQGVLVHPGAYRLDLAKLEPKQDRLLDLLQAIVKRQQTRHPELRWQPHVLLLVEAGGQQAFNEARQQLLFAGVNWPVSLKVVEGEVQRHVGEIVR